MNELVTRWDWICVGIVVGVVAVKLGEGLKALFDSWILTNDLKLQNALHSDLLRMQEKLDNGRSQ